MSLQFLYNDKGKTTAVLVPIKDWEAIQEKLQKEPLKSSLEQSITELKLMKDGKLPEPDIKDLFND